jgi:hypothetical protein
MVRWFARHGAKEMGPNTKYDFDMAMFGTKADIGKLGVLLTGITRRLLYVQAISHDRDASGGAGAIRTSCDRYFCPRRVSVTAKGSLVWTDEGTSDEPEVLVADTHRQVQWHWFHPNPRSHDSARQYDLVQHRKMTPLTIVAETADGTWRETLIYLVPPEVLRRPPSDTSCSSVGEPWCHRCNATFFWDPTTREVPTLRSSRDALRCTQCWMPLRV